MDDWIRSADPIYDEYRAALRAEQMPRRLLGGSIAAALTILGFMPVDYWAFPDLWVPFAGLRVATALLIAVLYVFPGRKNPEAATLGVAVVTGLALLSVTAATGGADSLYAPGLILLFVGLPVLTPVTAIQAIGVCGLLTVGFAAFPAFVPGTGNITVFGINLMFLLSAALISATSSRALDMIRFADFKQRRELEEARDHLKSLDEAKSRFTANIHHELRTPLTLMLAPLEAMRSGDFGEMPAGIGRTLRTMHVNGQRLLKLINNLLDLAKLESQQFTVTRRPMDVGRVLEDVVEGARAMADRKGIELVTEGLESCPRINADSDALEKVVVNLLGNALKFTDEGGCIRVTAAAVEGGVELAVIDNGIGLEPAQLARVFDRFAQVDASATRKHEGTGIGLSLTQELVEMHQGRVWAESEGLGHGATMRVFLPIGVADAEAEEEVLTDDAGRGVKLGQSMQQVEAELELDEADTPAQPFVEMERSVERWEAHRDEARANAGVEGNAGPDIVIAEDNRDMRELLCHLLGREHRVRAARNGREALELVREREPDLVVTDVMMPEMSGTELCREIKNDPATRLVPVMIVSSKAESEMKIEGLELGADDYVTKPFHPRELLARARSLVGIRRLQRELAERNEALESTLAELQQAEVQLVQSERLAAVGELAAGIAHEVNNPVNFATNALRALHTSVADLREVAEGVVALDWSDSEKLARDGAALRRHVEEISVGELAEMLTELSDIVTEGLERTAKLVGDLRDFAAPGRGGERARVDLGKGLASTEQLLSHHLAKMGAELHVDVPPGLPRVMADPGAINQVFLNLIKNAAEAMEDAGGHIWAKAEAVASGVQVSIRDDGPGIAPDAAQRLFEPFFTTKEAGSGTGLGLSISRQIATAHGGTLEMDSTPGEGTCFTLTLPAEGSGEVAEGATEAD